eukprot:scaffold91652_cov15-Tisochrysis_lutea.AAC.1
MLVSQVAPAAEAAAAACHATRCARLSLVLTPTDLLKWISSQGPKGKEGAHKVDGCWLSMEEGCLHS